MRLNLQFGLFILMSIALPCLVGSEAIAWQAPTRTLEFPTDRSMGMLYVGQPDDTPFNDIKVYGDEFNELGAAQGTIEVPADVLVRLDVSLDACRDLSPLKNIPADGLHFLYFNVRAPIEGQLQNISHLTGLRILYLRGCPINDKEMRNLANLKNLESLQCSAYGHADAGYGITDESMKLFGEFAKLKVLTLRANPITDLGLEELANCNELEVLSLSGSKVTGRGLNSLYMLPNLKSISFGVYNEGSPVDDEGMKTLGQLTQLEHLNLTATLITDEGLAEVANIKNLQTLSLDNTNISDHGLMALSDLENLSRLRFYRDKGPELGDVAAKHLSKCPSLKRVTAHWNLTSEGVESLTQFPMLESIDLTDTATDAHLPLVARMKGLKHISIQNCPITDDGIAHLEAMVGLEHFSLHGTKATAGCLKTLVKLPNLTLLRLGLDQNADAPYYWPGEDWNLLSGMENLEILKVDGLLLGDEQWHVFSNLKKLERLEMDYHSGLPLTSGFVNAIAKLENLNSLEMRQCNFESADFETLGNLKKLQYLTMTGSVSEDDLFRLSGLPALRILQLHSSLDISEAAIEEFKQKSKVLQTLSVRKKDSAPSLSVNDDGIVVELSADSARQTELAAMLDQPAPKLIGENVPPNNEYDLSQFEGKIVVVHFWRALSLGREPRPDETHVMEVMEKFKDHDIQVVGVHVTAGADRMDTFIAEQDVDWPCFADKDNQSSELWKNHRNRRNRLYLVDREGKLQMAHVYLGDLENAIKKMLDTNEKSASKSK